MKKIIFSIILIAVSSSNLYSWEAYDRVLAVVNNRPVIESDVSLKFKQLQSKKKISSRKKSYEKSRILDSFIENELIFETAERESIQITDKRVISQLENFMRQFFSRKIRNKKKLAKTIEKVSKNMELMLNQKDGKKFKLSNDLHTFISYIERKEKVPFPIFFKELKTKVAKEQIMTIAIGATPPSKSEAKKWYRKHRSKLGYEVLSKHILIIPKSKSLSNEKAANKKIEKIRKRILAGESFEKLAKKYSQDPGSAARGGDLGWQMLAGLDPYFAGNVFRMKKKGQISRVFKSGFGYHVVKYLGRRSVNYKKVEKMIMYKLYTEGLQKQFQKWVDKKREDAAVRIYMKNYIKG